MNSRPTDRGFTDVCVVTFRGLCRSLSAGPNTEGFGLGVPLLIILQMALWLHTTSYAGPNTTSRLRLW